MGANRKSSGQRKDRFQFEKDVDSSSSSEDDETMKQKDDALTQELNRYSSHSSKKGKDIGQHSKGFMYAAGGGSERNAEDYVPGKRERVGFVEADKEENAEKDVKIGLHYTENAKRAKKERERRDKEKWHDQYDNDRRRRRRRSRSRSRSRSVDRRRKRRRRDYSNDRDDNRDRGRWRGGR